MNKAKIVEIFDSIQGEGLYVGHKQIFVRFSGCNLNCRYCDTNSNEQENCKIYQDKNNFKEIKNPVSYKKLIKEIQQLNSANHHSISLTGGEPLIHCDFLKNFLEQNKRCNLQIYLETNGTLARELKIIAPYIDIISMDIKIESSTGQPFMFKEHAEFIETANSFNKELFAFFIKVVISPDINEDEINLIKKLLKNSKNEISLILQPLNKSGLENKISSKKLISIQNEFLKDIKDVRVIPQVHKYLGLK